ncbi:MAG: GAF domain-containing protein [Thermodesulfobacteriota bacterium]
MVIVTLIENIALLVTLSVLYQLILKKIERGELLNQILAGFLFGGMGVAVMMTPFRFAPGIIFDTRSIILSVAGLFGGPVVAAVGAVSCSAYRIWLGGSGAGVGIMVIATSALLGTAFHYLRRKDERYMHAGWLVVFGLLVHLVMLALMLTLPGGIGPQVLRHLALPVLLAYPLATVIVCRIFLGQQKQMAAEMAVLESESRYRMLTETSQTGIYIHQDEIIVYANNRFAELHGYTLQELLGTNYFDLFDPMERARTREIKSKRLKREAAPRVHETKRIRKDGSTLWCLTEAVRIDYQGKPAIMGNVVDITERKMAEEQRDGLVLKLQEALVIVETLSAISQSVNKSLNLDQVLYDALDKIMDLFKAHSANIRLLDNQTQELVNVAQRGLSPEDTEKIPKRQTLGKGAAGLSGRSGEVVVIEDILNDPRAENIDQFLSVVDCRSLVALPLFAKDKLVGTISFRHQAPRKYNVKKIDLFKSIGHQVGTAIENANLFSQIRRNTEVLAALNSVSDTISQTLDIERLTGVVLDKVVEVLRCDAGTIRLLDETGQALEIVAHKGFSLEQAKKMNINRKYGEGLAWRCLDSGQVVFTEFNPEDSYQQEIKSFGMQIGARCAVHFPIEHKDIKLGIMTVYSFSPREFQREELDLCTSIGHQIGIAIENARLYQRAQNNIKALRDAQEEREKIIMKLQKALADVKTLSGLLPICSHCKKIRDDKGYWTQIEAYIHQYSGTQFSHGICPECAKKYYPEYKLYDD